jgi:hypothetical protein
MTNPFSFPLAADAVYLWVIKYWSGAIIFTIFAVFSLLAYPGMRRRIPLSKQLLLFVIRIAKHNPSVYVIALLGTAIQTAYSAFWSFAVVAIYQKYTPGSAGSSTAGGSASNGKVIGLMVFAVFSYFWTTQFIMFVSRPSFSRRPHPFLSFPHFLSFFRLFSLS